MKPLTLDFHSFVSFGWVNPGESLGGRPLDTSKALAFGAFLYQARQPTLNPSPAP